MAVYEIRPEVEDLCREIILAVYDFIDMADDALLDLKQFEKTRNQVTKKYSIDPPRNIELLAAYNKMLEEGIIEENEAVFKQLVKRKVRTLSGIANITVLMKEFTCPGKCIFCPTQPGMPKSYFSTQPAMLRAVRNNFNCYNQMKTRLNGLKTQGHDTSKIDVRTAGGTWSSYPEDYQEFFVKSIYFALNEGPGEFLDLEIAEKKINEAKLEDLIKENETAECRCVGLWVETRPDWITVNELLRLRRYGVTGIELGIQTTDDKVNEFCVRGHGLKESIKATQMCRDVGLKICHHIMPNLPTSTLESDLQTVRDLFDKDILNPDYIKVYPCILTPFTELQEMVKKDPSIFKPYTDEELIEILTEIIAHVPEYCRIIRILRDFPSDLVLKGTKTSNIRQVLERKGVKSQDIRAREIKNEKITDTEIRNKKYRSNEGTEHFISIDEPNLDKLIGLVRLRLPDQSVDYIPELKDAALIRELHVYGQQKGLGDSKVKSKSQHKGFGKQLMAEAEKTAKEAGYNKVAVISAIGTREYYKKLGYKLEGTYMTKVL